MPTDASRPERCRTCGILGAIDTAPVSERIYWDGTWRITHALDSALPGWLVVIPARHVLSLGDLNGAEAASLGPLLTAASRALVSVTGSAKTYLASFAEKEGFTHLHIHLIPRHANLEPGRRGPGIFGYLDRPAAEQVPAAERERLALALRDAMQPCLI
ncbi:MAG TPA: HIT family protein [Candidatus Dormibacteraeota bacterium]|jgi:diadenosine tetraphosphate (Ap4A) HIT family hydrolase|nr:HIT family protein [Candidatus Dormibacteraeota bacterium]